LDQHIRRDGHETWHRLLEWTKQQTPAERLAGHILRFDGFSSLDPVHPLGGQDGLKDITAMKDGKQWIAAAYFPRGKQTFKKIKDKFLNDAAGLSLSVDVGFAFITNQELRLAQRSKLTNLLENIDVEIYHLERIAQTLDSPQAYGIRLEFLDIPMSKEDQISFFAWLESRNSQAISAAFQTERRLLAVEQHRRSQAQLRNHNILLSKIFEQYKVISWCVTTPILRRTSESGMNIDMNFTLNDMKDIFDPSLIMRFPLQEAVVDRYIKIQRKLVKELVSLIKVVDHTNWPELPELCQEIISAIEEHDYSEVILSSSNMFWGGRPQRDIDAEYLKESAEDDFVIVGNHALDPYRALALQIKKVIPLAEKFEELVEKSMSSSPYEINNHFDAG
jgi:hypothetical protein